MSREHLNGQRFRLAAIVDKKAFRVREFGEITLRYILERRVCTPCTRALSRICLLETPHYIVDHDIRVIINCRQHITNEAHKYQKERAVLLTLEGVFGTIVVVSWSL